jgi:hypothetical protein
MKRWSHKHFFLLDGLGAVFSALMLGVVLVHFHAFIGIPKDTLLLLAAFPVVFAVYDFVCFYSTSFQKSAYLKGIAIANFTYVLLSAFILFKHAGDLSLLGWLYFVGELIIVLGLGILEWRKTVATS